MSTFQMRQALDSGTWFRCTGKSYLGSHSFRLRFKSFRVVAAEEIDNPTSIKDINLTEGLLWILSIDVVNTGREAIRPYDVTYPLRLVDHDSCSFSLVSDTYLTCLSTFSRRTGLLRLSGIGRNLSPKLVVEGAILFQLPDEDGATYQIGVNKDGTIEEV
jgi:hypothetical protein